MGDILSFPELQEVTISLMDIDEEQLHTSEIIAHKIVQATEANATIEVMTDRCQALSKADYVICIIRVAGYVPGIVIDFEVPKKYGLRQTIADTLGISGIMRGLHTVPVLLDICQDVVFF